MSIQADYEAWMARRDKMALDGLNAFNLNQHERYVHPFRVFGNLWYVGDSWVCAHIVDTGAGLLLFDAGHSGATAMLIQAIWEAGFDPRDVKWLVLSHGHVDHIAASRFFRHMFGTKIYLGAPDARMFRERPELAFIQAGSNMDDMLFSPDVEIHDGDRVQFGNTPVEFHLAPGHTEGCIACFFPVSDGASTKRAGYYGGFGFNTLETDYLLEIGDGACTMRQKYLQSLDRFLDEPVDIFMPNHTENVDLMAKLDYRKAHPDENPFVDSGAWKGYLSEKREELLRFMADNPVIEGH